MQEQHDVTEYRSGSGDPGNAVHGTAVKITHPYTNDIGIGESDTPVVTEILRRTGFCRAEKREVKRAVLAECRAAGIVVRQDIRDNVRHRFIEDRCWLSVAEIIFPKSISS